MTRLVGIVSAAAGLAVGQLLAGLTGPGSSPYHAVAGTVVDFAPRQVKDAAIAVFGPADKLVLFVGLAVLLAACAAGVGRLAVRSLGLAMLAVGLFGTVGVLCAVTRPDGGLVDVVPSLGATVAAMLALRGLVDLAPAGPEWADESADPAVVADARRRLLVASGLVTVAAVGTTLLGQWLTSVRYGAERSREAVRLPAPADEAPPPLRDPAAGIRGLSRFHTANDGFYRVDTALTVPQISAEEWELRIHGMVERPLRITYPQLLRRPLVERDITLACVSNSVGGPYLGNARWLGVQVADLLREAGVDPGADQVVSRSYDGMTIGTPTVALTDGRDALLAVGMNGEPLPLRHGFPVRMVVPGLYGYVSACKWLAELELTTFARYDAYWVRQGWARRAEVKTASRIDVPRDGARRRAGVVTVAGVAWAQHRGIQRVEVAVDDSPWAQAELAPVNSVDTWRQWRYRWHAEPGRHRLRVRATDAHGDQQTGTPRDPYPDGATGWHEVTVVIVA